MSRIEIGDGWEMRLGRWQDSPPTSPLAKGVMVLDARAPGVDVTISDPPYGKRTHQNGRRGKGWKGKAEDKRVICERAPKSFDPIDPADVAPWLVGLTRRWVVCFCEIEQVRPNSRISGSGFCVSCTSSTPTPANSCGTHTQAAPPREWHVCSLAAASSATRCRSATSRQRATDSGPLSVGKTLLRIWGPQILEEA